MVAQIDVHYARMRPGRALVRLASYAFFEGRPVTTRGRWVNPFIFAHFAIEKRLPPFRKVDRPIFVLGTGRSGTTILGVVMSMHSDVGFLNEPKALWHAIHPGEDLAGSYSREPGRFRLIAEDVSAQVRRHASRLFGAYAALTRSRRVVDKYPELIFRIPFVRSIFPDARFLLLVRNGHDTVASIDAWSRRHGGQRDGVRTDWWGVNNRKWQLICSELVPADIELAPLRSAIEGLSTDIDRAAVEWLVTMREGIRQRNEHADSIHMVLYEDLVRDPRAVLTGIAEFAGLFLDETFLAYGEEVLKPGKTHEPPKIAAILRPLFEQTMKDLGYTCDPAPEDAADAQKPSHD